MNISYSYFFHIKKCILQRAIWYTCNFHRMLFFLRKSNQKDNKGESGVKILSSPLLVLFLYFTLIFCNNFFLSFLKTLNCHYTLLVRGWVYMNLWGLAMVSVAVFSDYFSPFHSCQLAFSSLLFVRYYSPSLSRVLSKNLMFMGNRLN